MAPRAIVFTLANPDPEVAPLLLPVFGQPALCPVGDGDSVEQTLNGHFILQGRTVPAAVSTRRRCSAGWPSMTTSRFFGLMLRSTTMR
jgi:hypothetical protein